MPFFKVDDYYKSRGLQAPGVINDDRACLACGYALRGLREGQRCPECGRPIIPLRGQGLAEAQTGDLQRLAFALLAACVGWAAGMGIWLWAFFDWLGDFFLFFAGAQIAALAFAVIVGTRAWIAVQPPRNRFENWLPFWIRAVFTFAALLTLALVLTRLVGSRIVSAGAVIGLSTLASFAWMGLQALACLLFRSIAIAGQDERLGDRFWHVAWAVGLCAALIGPVLSLTQSLMAGAGVMSICCMSGYLIVVAMLAAQLLFAHSLFRLHAMIRWSIKYRIQYDDKTSRMMQRVQEGREIGDREGSVFARERE